MPKEDIFNEYAKIAVETGLVKVAKEDSSISKKSKNTRLDYSSSEAIQALYGIKPDGNESANYEKNIAQYAHPNSVVVAPAHDKINGLVENINERQNIMLNIVNDPANGNLNQRKYAKSELVQALVRVANDMDNKDEEELRILADYCIDGVVKVADSPGLLEESWDAVKKTFNVSGRMAGNLADKLPALVAAIFGAGLTGLVGWIIRGFLVGMNLPIAPTLCVMAGISYGLYKGYTIEYKNGSKDIAELAKIASYDAQKLLDALIEKNEKKRYAELKDLKKSLDVLAEAAENAENNWKNARAHDMFKDAKKEYENKSKDFFDWSQEFNAGRSADGDKAVSELFNTVGAEGAPFQNLKRSIELLDEAMAKHNNSEKHVIYGGTQMKNLSSVGSSDSKPDVTTETPMPKINNTSDEGRSSGEGPGVGP